jgi:hypothetical protein
MTNLMGMSAYETRFWLLITGDHARFVRNALLSSEEEWIEQSEHFITLFDILLSQAHDTASAGREDRFFEACYDAALQIRTFFLQILRRQISSTICINLAPTFTSQFARQTEEFLREMEAHKDGDITVLHPLHYHLMWLWTCSVHADAVNVMVDPSERDTLRQFHRYMRSFTNLYLQALEFSDFIKTGLQDFPALSRFNQRVEAAAEEFASDLLKLETASKENKILGSFYPLILNHMYREACFFITKLAESNDIEPPSCELALDRRE